MTAFPSVPKALQSSPFGVHTGVDFVTYRQLCGPSYQRLTRGAYVAAGGFRTHRELIQAMRAVLPPEAVLGGLSAAWAHGVHTARPDSDVEVILPPSRRVRSRAGLVVRGDGLRPGETVSTDLGLATSGARTAFDLGRTAVVPNATTTALLTALPARQVVQNLSDEVVTELSRVTALVDSVLRATGDSIDSVAVLSQEHPGVRGSKVLRVALALADPRAESPPESVLRTSLILGGLPWPVPQYVVLGPDGEFIARVDLAWPDRRLALEYDGTHHNETRQFRADRARDTRLQLAGWRPIHLTADDLRPPSALRQMLGQAVLLQPPPP